MSLILKSFGAIDEGDALALAPTTATLPEVGLVTVRGEGAEALARLLARQEATRAWRRFGACEYHGLDWRILPPARLLDAADLSERDTLLDLFAFELSPEAFIHSVSEGTLQERCEAHLAAFSLREQTPQTRFDALSESSRLEVSLVMALAGDAPLLLLRGQVWGGLPVEFLECISSKRLVFWLCDDRILPAGVSPAARLDLAEIASVQAPPEGPPGFQWFAWEAFGGMPRPGTRGELSEALEALREVGVSHVLCLEEVHEHAEAVREARLVAWHFPIVDMDVPERAELARWCERVEQAIAQGGRVAIHCKAGLGRTGTVAAALLMRRGHGFGETLTLMREWDRGFVQSEAQLEFLRAYGAGHGREATLPVQAMQQIEVEPGEDREALRGYPRGVFALDAHARIVSGRAGDSGEEVGEALYGERLFFDAAPSSQVRAFYGYFGDAEGVGMLDARFLFTWREVPGEGARRVKVELVCRQGAGRWAVVR